MFALTVRDHIMIAHSFEGAVFGPAQRLHGATYIIDVEFRRRELDGDGLVVDIGLAGKALTQVLEGLNYRNLDDVADYAGTNTTTEFLAKAIYDRMAESVRNGGVGDGGRDLASMKVTLHESHVAWASYEADLG